MALMTDIRNNMAKLFGVLAVLFIVMIVFDWGLDLTGRKGRNRGNVEVVGEVNGKEITYREYSELIRRATENQKKQTGNDPDEETDRQIRSQVWNQLVDETLIDQEIDRLGITVSDQEIVDIVTGPNPPDFLVAQFRDSTGTFRRDLYQQAMLDPQNKQAWLQIEDALRIEQRRRKVQSILMASVRVSEGDVLQAYRDRNLTLDAEYVLFDANRLVSDSAVTVTDADLQKQYDTHPEDFKAKASRKLKYVVFSQSASAEDSAAVKRQLDKIKENVQSGARDFAEAAKIESEVPLSDAFFKHGELSAATDKAVFSAKKGDLVGPIQDVDGYHLVKILAERQGKDEYFRASHILLNAVVGPDSVKVIQKAKDLLRQARGGADFAALARANSEDYGSAMQGGDLGWNTRGRMVKPFEDAIFKARVGEIIGPVRTQFGWHIIKVTGKDRREVQIANLTLRVRASSMTTDLALKSAEEFGVLAKSEGFEKSAELSKYQVRETPEFTKGSYVPGIGVNDAVNYFAFSTKEGGISEPLGVSGGVGVFMVSGLREDGLRPLSEVTGIVRTMAMREKKMEKVRAMAESFRNSISAATDLLAAAQTNPNATAQRTGPFRPVDAPQGVGRDAAFIGTAMSLKAGELSKPFDGLRGEYILKLMSRVEPDTTRFAVEKAGLRAQLLQDYQRQLMTQWQADLREKATIIDHRDKFYR